ncbi:hypothetical protein J3R30DRAFT_3697572 [Lentinula aciculospora]|uniref:Protein kinase domain-containing protein n=1 Tax=Lentinula aciculospora TaxID=153920 RepID=A0A9W9AML4_9AGAR|nr:hypothetical protein J3R30DRAFT_3697572 [Lentinula aciculospora]
MIHAVVSPQNNYTRQHHHITLPATSSPLLPPQPNGNNFNPNNSNSNGNNTNKCISVVGIPSVHISNNRLVVGSSSSSSTRSYTPLKVLGDGSFGTVWLCDWHGTLPPNTPLSPMQCGAGARPEWVGKRLVAVKRMKKRWEGGWDECRKLKELESLRAIPFHPNIIPLYDFFLMPATKELYFVFESMEGNLYHLIKARKGRPLAGGLVASIFFQIVSGLSHIHEHGYFHRDMKPENVLVTTTGLFDYTSLSPIAPKPNPPLEKDVVAIIKLADFGLARETKSKPPYTEYVSTRWYRAPEVLLLSRDYSNPVDMWALGTIMAELVNLRPLFPGSDQVDQIGRICDVLGNPANDYGVDVSGAPIGGGAWLKGLDMAKQVGFEFRKMPPQDIHSLFDRSVPTSLIHCIRDLLKFNPDARLTSHECLHHRYLVESLPRNDIPLPPGVRLATPLPSSAPSISTLSPRSIPPSHSHTSQLHIPPVSASHRTSFFASGSATNGHVAAAAGNDGDYPTPMDISPQTESPEYSLPNGNGHSHVNGMTTHVTDPLSLSASQSQSSTKVSKFSGFGKKFGLGRFGSDKHTNQNHDLPPVHDLGSSSTGSLNRSPSNGSDTWSLRGAEPSQLSPPRDTHPPIRPEDIRRNKKKAESDKKEAERLHLEAEKQRRALAEKMQREQARAVMQKRNFIIQQNSMKGGAKGATEDIEWRSGGSEHPSIPLDSNLNQGAGPGLSAVAKGKQPVGLGPIRTRTRDRDHHANGVTVSPRLHHPHPSHPPVSGFAVAGPSSTHTHETMDYNSPGERSTKLRRMDLDDDVSSVVSSSTDVHSTGRSSVSRMSQLSQVSAMSAISFATVGTVDTFNTFNSVGSSNTVDTVGSDPGPSRPSRSRPGIRNRPSLLGLNRVSSTGRAPSDNFNSAPPVPPLPNFSSSHLYTHAHTPSQHSLHSHNSQHSYHTYRSSHTHSPSTPSARSSNSFNNVLDGQLAHDFRNLASTDQDHPQSSTVGESPPRSISPPPMQMLSLSSPSHSHQHLHPQTHPRSHSHSESHSQSRSHSSLSPLSPSSPSLSPSPMPISPQSRYNTTLQVPSLSSRRGQAPPPYLNVTTGSFHQRSTSYSPRSMNGSGSDTTPNPYEHDREYGEYVDQRGYTGNSGYAEEEFQRGRERVEEYHGRSGHDPGGGTGPGYTDYHHSYTNHSPNTHLNPPSQPMPMRNKRSADQIYSNSPNDEVINPIFKVVSYSYTSWDVNMGGLTVKPESPTSSTSSAVSPSASSMNFVTFYGDDDEKPPLPTPTSSDPTEDSFNTMDTRFSRETRDSMDSMDSKASTGGGSMDTIESRDSYDSMMEYTYHINPTYISDRPANATNDIHHNTYHDGGAYQNYSYDQRPLSISLAPSLPAALPPPSLPPFATLEAVAGGGFEYPPMSPVSFTAPSESEEVEAGD